MESDNKRLFILAIPISILVITLVLFIEQFSAENEDAQTPTSSSTSESLEDFPEIGSDSPGSIPVDSKEAVTEEAENSNIVEVATETLSVNTNRCRGCGKCTMIDPAHFKMAGRVAVVISQENLGSNTLASAISLCPDNAINLS